ncbi:hypothetical protein [Robertmurraya sp. P23]
MLIPIYLTTFAKLLLTLIAFVNTTYHPINSDVEMGKGGYRRFA